MTEEEQRLALIEAMRGLTEQTRYQSEAANAAAAETNRLASAEKDAAAASARSKAKFDAVAGAAGAVADAFITYNKEVYKGASASQAAAASIDKMGEAAKYAGAFLAILVPGGPIVKAFVAGLGLLTGELMKAGKEVAIQTDQIYKAYQDMAKAGATGAGGMQDVFDSLQKVGLGTEKFGEYLKLVNENAQDLAMFGGTVRSGRKEFEKTMGSLTAEQRVQMEQMGLDRTAQAESTMNYIKQQRLLTMGTKEQMNTSSAAVMKYIKETDELTRITGLGRKEQEKVVEEAMRRQQYASTIDQLVAEGKIDEANQLKQGLILAQKAGKGVADAYMDSVSGFVGTTEASRKGFMTTNGEILNFVDTLKSGKLSTEQVMQGFNRVGQATKEFYDNVGQSAAQMGNLESVGLSIADTRNLINMSNNDMETALSKAKKEQQDALNDKTTEDMAKSENKARETQLFLQRELNTQMGAFITALGKGQTANQEMTDYIMNDLMPVFKDLWDSLKPLGTELLALVKELTPFLKLALEGLIKAVQLLTKVINVFNNAQEGTNLQSGTLKDGNIIGGASGMGDAAAILDAQAAGPDTGPKQPSTMPAWMKKWMPWLDNSNTPTAPGGDTANEIPLEARADGGPVSAKTPYLVGEEGPELFVPSLAGDIVPTGKLQGTSETALKQSQAIEDMVSQIVLNTTAIAKTADVDADRATDHSKELKTQREKIDNAIKEIAVNSVTMESVYKTDLKRAQDYSIFYKGFIETKTKFEKEQLDVINYQMTEGGSEGGGGGGESGVPSARGGARPSSSGTGLKLPAMPGISSMGGAQGMQTARQDDLKKLGLNVKEGDVQAEGAGISPKLIEMARQIQGGVPGFNYFSAFNDKFHQEKAPSSQHAKGLAVDFTVAQPPSVEDGKAITDWLKGLGASLAIDEYNNPSSKSTAGHFHAQIPGFEEGGTLGAGKVGIAGEGGAPELITGPANITPMNDLMRAFGEMTTLLQASVGRLDAIARHTAATQDSSNKMLSYAQN